MQLVNGRFIKAYYINNKSLISAVWLNEASNEECQIFINNKENSKLYQELIKDISIKDIENTTNEKVY